MDDSCSVLIAIIIGIIGLLGSLASGNSEYMVYSLFILGLGLLVLFLDKKEKQKQQNEYRFRRTSASPITHNTTSSLKSETIKKQPEISKNNVHKRISSSSGKSVQSANLLQQITGKPSAQEREDAFTRINLPSGVDRSQVDAIGLEMSSGYWILLKDDTLYFREGDYLGNGTYGRYRHRVKRIVIEDYKTVQISSFMGFSECREVIFTNPSVRLQTAVFKHCHKLESVIFAGDCVAMDDAFRDTPYEAKLQNAEFVPEFLLSSVIAQGEWGREFLENTRREIELMYTPEGPQDDVFVYTPDPSFDDDHEGLLCSDFGFADSIGSIIRGGAAGEPEMLYLLAEMFYYNFFTYMNEAAAALAFFSDDFHDVTFCDLYLRAAEAGSGLAGLWCAYSMDTGKNEFPSDPQRAEDILGKITKIPDTLALRELSFLADEADKLTQKAYDVDAEEDIIGNQYDFKPGTYEHLLPDPDWIKLHARSDNVLRFMLAFGLPYIIDKNFYNGRFYGKSDIEKIAAEKSSWLD